MASSAAPRLRLAHFNDIYELKNLPRVQTFLAKVQPDATVLSGDFLSPSTLSSVDGGKGMIRTLRAVGLTHCCLGNHEADLKLSALQTRLQKLSKTTTVLNSNIGRNLKPEDLNSKTSKIPDWIINNEWMPEYSVISTPCDRVKIALGGFMSDEPGMFPTGTFRGVPIGSVTETYSKMYADLIATNTVQMILPLTHQFIERDKELAEHMLQVSGGTHGLILGGHEHTPFDETVSRADKEVRILKSGQDANAVDLIDLTFDPETLQLTDIQAELVEMKSIEPSFVVSNMVKEHMKVLEDLENEDVIHADVLLPPGTNLSSVGTRYRQTSVGAIFGTAIKDELEVDVAIINGATIKGNTAYDGTSMSYAALKQELPFPTKIVVVPMKRWELHEAIHYSRTKNPDRSDQEDVDPSIVERKGFLQVDTEFDRIGFHTGGQDDDLMVALPRNLLNGFCKIEPLVDIGDRLKAENCFPDEDTYIKAIDLVVRHFCKEQWFEMVSDNVRFDDLDLDHNGYLTRDEVVRFLKERIGHDPAEFVVDNMIAAIDEDGNGVIDPGEFSHLLADIERQHGLIRFD